MVIGGTTVGPIEEDLRDQLKDYRDREGHDNYNAALRALLQKEDN